MSAVSKDITAASNNDIFFGDEIFTIRSFDRFVLMDTNLREFLFQTNNWRITLQNNLISKWESIFEMKI